MFIFYILLIIKYKFLRVNGIPTYFKMALTNNLISCVVNCMIPGISVDNTIIDRYPKMRKRMLGFINHKRGISIATSIASITIAIMFSSSGVSCSSPLSIFFMVSVYIHCRLMTIKFKILIVKTTNFNPLKYLYFAKQQTHSLTPTF